MRHLVQWGAGVLLLATTSVSCAQAPAFQLKKCTPLPATVQMHGCAVVGNRVYVLGGNTSIGDTWANEVYSAEIKDKSGELSEWRKEREMPERRYYISSSVEVVNNRIYVVGGYASPAKDTPEKDTKATNDTLWTSVNADGSLSEWKHSDPMPGTTWYCAATCSSDKNLFVVGGRGGVGGGGDVLDTIVTADLDADGKPTKWRQAAKMPLPLWFHGAAVIDDRMYLWGGLYTRTSTDVNRRVFSAPVNKDGSLGAWLEESSQMLAPVYSSAFCGFNDHLIAVGGRFQDAVPNATINFARLQDKHPQAWSMIQTDLNARVYHAAGLDRTRGIVFVTGGQHRLGKEPNGTVLNTVQAFQIAQPQSSRMGTAAETGAKSAADLVRLPAALEQAKANKSGVVAFFYSPEVPACRRAWDNVVSRPEFRAAIGNRHLAGVDVSGPESSLGYEHGVFKVPCLAAFGPDGTLIKQTREFESVEAATKSIGTK